MMSVRQFTGVMLVTLVCFSGSENLFSAEVPSWSSFLNNGSNRITGTLPVNWSHEKGIAWQCETTGYGQSTPVIWGETVYLSSVLGDQKDQSVLTAYQLSTGKQLWQKSIQAETNAPSNYMIARAAPTPVVDAQGVYVFYETGDLLAFDHGGKQLWHRTLSQEYGPFINGHGIGSSPVQNKSHLFLALQHDGPSCILAIDKSSGKQAWKRDCESAKAWASPVLWSQGDREALILSSAGSCTSYSTEDGSILWQMKQLVGNRIPTPTIDQNRLYLGARIPEFGTTKDAAQSNLCLELTSTGYETKWQSRKATCDYASPVIANGCAYYITKAGILYCLDSETGSQNYAVRLGMECWATPIADEKHLFLFGKDGETKVVALGAEYQEVAKNGLWDLDAPPRPESYVEFAGSGGHGHGHGSSHGHGSASGHGSAAGTNHGHASKTDSHAHEHEHEHSSKPEHAEAKAETGKPSHAAAHGHSSAQGHSSQASGSSRGGMIERLLKGDANGDKQLTADELSESFRPMFPRVDLNGDGVLDLKELEEMETKFRERRKGARDNARDPIVYGVAAVNQAIVIRTGTRLYAIHGPNPIGQQTAQTQTQQESGK